MGREGETELAPHHLNAWNGLFLALFEQYWPTRTAKFWNFTKYKKKRTENAYDVFFFGQVITTTRGKHLFEG